MDITEAPAGYAAWQSGYLSSDYPPVPNGAGDSDALAVLKQFSDSIIGAAKTAADFEVAIAKTRADADVATTQAQTQQTLAKAQAQTALARAQAALASPAGSTLMFVLTIAGIVIALMEMK